MSTLVGDPPAAAAPAPAARIPVPRDLRLDLFRGIGLLLIFVNHVPDNPLYWFTIAGIMFCDAADMFVFISGYAAALAFGKLMRREGWLFAASQVLRRCWTLYVAHIFLFVIFTAQVAWTVRRLENPMFAEELNVGEFLRQPDVAVIRALLLQLQPIYMNILPLYIVLLGAMAALLPALRLGVAAIAVPSVALYAWAALTDSNLAAYPHGEWYFNPFAWQVLFFGGAVLGWRFEVERIAWTPPRWALPAAASVLAACLVLKQALNFERLPGEALEWVWLLADKTDAGPLRLLNFASLAVLTVMLVPRGAAWMGARWARPVVLLGQNSLNVFCFGIFLTVVAHGMVLEMGIRHLPQLLASAGGVVAMLALGLWADWSKDRKGAARGTGGGA